MATKHLELPVGLEAPNAMVKRGVEIKKLKGSLQREIQKLQTSKKPDLGAAIDAILLPSIIDLAGAAPTIGKLRQVSLADRDWLLFELLKLTWGNEVPVSDTCQECDPPTRMSYPKLDLDTLPVQRLEDEDAAWWDGKAVVSAAVAKTMTGDNRQALLHRVLVLENTDTQARGVFRIPDGRDQGLLAAYADRPIEAIWKLMSLTCIAWSDPEHKDQKIDTKRGLSEDFWADLDADVLGWAQIAFKDAQPGIDTVLDLECEAGHTKKVKISPLAFFFPEASAAARKT